MRYLLPFVPVLFPLCALADVPKVVTDIAPIHSLVAQVMNGVGAPDVLLSGVASPHDFQFSFDQAGAVQDADLVVWVGTPLTPWLADAIETLSMEDRAYELLGSEGWPSLERRDWNDEHDHAEDANEHEDENEHDLYDESSVDPHAWLNPKVAIVWTRNINAELSTMDPDNEATYLANAEATISRLVQLDEDIEAMLDDAPRGAILVPHDAYRYFGERYGVTAIGAISLSDATSPSPAHIDEMRALIRDAGVACVLSDPQSRVAWVELVREGSAARTALADPMGTVFAPGLDHYDQTLRAIAAAYVACLGG